MLQVDIEVKGVALCDNGQQVWRVQSRIDGCAETAVQCPNEGAVVVDIEAIESLAANVEVVEVALSTICSEENATLVSPRNRHLNLVDKIGKAGGAGRAIVELPGLRHYDVIGPVNKLAAADIVIYTPVIAIVIILQGIIQRQRATIGWIGVLRCSCCCCGRRIDIGSRSRGRCMASSRYYGRGMTARWRYAGATRGWMVEVEQEGQAAHAQGNDEDGQEGHTAPDAIPAGSDV